MLSVRCIYVNTPICKGRGNTLPCLSTPNDDMPVHGNYESNKMTDDTETTPAYLTAVYEQSVVGEEHGVTAGLGPVGRNTNTTNHEYVEGLCSR